MSTTQASPVSFWRQLYRVPTLIVWLLFCILLFSLVRLCGYKDWIKVPMLFHRGLTRIIAIQVDIKGSLSNHCPTLFVSNHISYLDIFLMGGYVPGYFIAKSEVASWPVFGSLAKLQNTLFVERRGKHARNQVGILQNHLSSDKNLILYPEGTSTDGVHVEPFKSSLFSAAEHETANIEIQPITICYTHYQGKPMDQFLRDHYAWYAEMPFLPHFASALGMGKARAELIFHPPVKPSDFSSRKECAAHCQAIVAEALTTSLAADPEESDLVHATAHSHRNN